MIDSVVSGSESDDSDEEYTMQKYIANEWSSKSEGENGSDETFTSPIQLPRVYQNQIQFMNDTGKLEGLDAEIESCTNGSTICCAQC